MIVKSSLTNTFRLELLIFQMEPMQPQLQGSSHVFQGQDQQEPVLLSIMHFQTNSGPRPTRTQFGSSSMFPDTTDVKLAN